MQNLRREAFLFPQQSQHQMFSPNVLVVQPLGLFGSIRQHALALMAQWQIHRRRYLLADRRVRLDLFPDRFNGRVRPQKAVRQRLVFAQQPQQQMLCFYVRTAELGGFITGEENDPAGFLGVSFKHGYSPAVTSASPPCCNRKTRSHDRAKSRLCVT